MKDVIDITVITPFYYGNNYMARLLTSIKQCIELCKESASFEVIIVNDSPTEKVHIPEEFAEIDIRIIVNEQNMGIQKTRINGLKYAHGEWIIFLDQDDELIPNGLEKQIELTKQADIVVGNSIYILGDVHKQTYKNLKTMNYLISEKRFLQIRNLIPSPGECLIRKVCIPKIWIENPIKTNGADDWFLWITLFKAKAKYVCNEELVYIHNDANGKNLSVNIKKMKISSLEMLDILKRNNILTVKETIELENAIYFKYNQDTYGLTAKIIFKYYKTFFYNVVYKYNCILLKNKE